MNDRIPRLFIGVPVFLLAASSVRAQGPDPTQDVPVSSPPAASTQADPAEAPRAEAAPLEDRAESGVEPATALYGARVDVAAEAKYTNCLDLLRAGKMESARSCFSAVRTQAPDTEAALKADASLVVLDLRLAPPATSAPAETGFNIPPGRLGATAVSGLFGAWNAIAGGLIVSNFVDGGTSLAVGTGLTAVAAGIGFGAGGYFLADRLKLDEGAARLFASGLLWGTVVGVMVAPAIFESLRDPVSGESRNAAVASIATVVGSGYVLGGLGLLLAASLPFDEAQAGLTNSGGIVGSIIGIVVVSNLGNTSPQGVSPAVASSVLASSALLGLVSGGALGRVLDMTWGEVLLSDLGGLLGLLAGGAVGIGLGANTNNFAIASISTASGVLVGYGTAIGLVALWRNARGVPVLRGAPVTVMPSTSAVLDAGHVVPTFGATFAF